MTDNRKPPASTRWVGEASIVGDEEVTFQPRHADAATGVQVIRLTALPVINSHIYPEAPISFPDGRRFVWRRADPMGQNGRSYLADLDTLRVRQLTDEPDASTPIVSPDGQWLYYVADGAIWRMDGQSFERARWYDFPEELGQVGGVATISSDGQRVAAGVRRDGHVAQVVSIDLVDRTWQVAFEHADCRNPHVQYCRHDARKLLIQVNDGIEFDEHGNLTRLIGDYGASLHVVNDDSTDHVKLPVGSSLTERVQGHQCWVGGQDRVFTTTHRRESPSDPWHQHILVAVSPGDHEATVVADGSDLGACFTHAHTSDDGRYWLCDCNRTGNVYVGSMTTGKFKLFCESHATFGCQQFTHPHPFFLPGTPGPRTIGWNSDNNGNVPHAYVAAIPAGFLDELD